jgi:hypothetical protein
MVLLLRCCPRVALLLSDRNSSWVRESSEEHPAGGKRKREDGKERGKEASPLEEEVGGHADEEKKRRARLMSQREDRGEGSQLGLVQSV